MLASDTNGAPMRLLKERIKSKLARGGIVIAGLVLGQILLYGPSLVGRKILLPLDTLARPGVYLPTTPETGQLAPHDRIRADLVYFLEPARRFAVSEWHSGRVPMWTPYQFSGAPFIWPKFSPFSMLQCLTASPVVLAWSQLFAALVAGTGAYFFFRRVLGVGFWPAAVAAWCYPLTGFFVFWQGFPTCGAVHWLPWILLATHGAARQNSRWFPIWLSLVTGLVLVSGHLDVAAQVLIASGLFAIWSLYDACHPQWIPGKVRRALLSLAIAWLLGFLLAAPHVLPAVEYALSGARMDRRGTGEEERPPAGLSALPQIVLPDVYGTMGHGSLYLTKGNQLESAAATYAGLFATLVLAPLAWYSQRHRKINLFLALISLFALSWCLNIPGLVDLLRIPGLNLLSHNRLVFIASFALLTMTAVGLEVVSRDDLVWRPWSWLPPAVLCALCVWCFLRANGLPEPLASQLEQAVSHGNRISWISDLDGVRQAQSWFVWHYRIAGILCGTSLVLWCGLR
ncbi:MAG: hypothetical protein EPO07_04655, partial [Verrucomicrobia bacterium]